MFQNTLRLTILSLLAFSSLFLYSEESQAGIIVYHYGPDVFPAGDFSDEKAQQNEILSGITTVEGMQDAKPAYMCETFGFFWTNFYIWDCKPVVMSGESYWDAESAPEIIAELEKIYTEDDMQIEFWDKHGRWFFLLAVLGLIGFSYLPKAEDEEEDLGMRTED